jgi:hypothetical protein
VAGIVAFTIFNELDYRVGEKYFAESGLIDAVDLDAEPAIEEWVLASGLPARQTLLTATGMFW